MWKGPGVREDAKNAALIGASALVGLAATAALFAANSSPQRVHVVRTEFSTPAPALRYEMAQPLTGVNRLYGTVQTRDGEQLTGFLRWDRNEGSWSDLLDATKFENGRARGMAGIRFGHIQRIESVGRELAVFTLRSGQEVGMTSRSSDLGSGLRALVVTEPSGASTELQWRDLRTVDFHPVPNRARPEEGRLHGTLTTRSGLQFTGFITWDVDEIYSTDNLDGEADGREYDIPFGAIESISRAGSRSAAVKLHTGEELVMSGSNDVDRRNRGISVSDPGLGQVKVSWSDFDNVVFHGTPDETSLDAFNGGGEIMGTVVTESGDELSGAIEWDMDENRTWEMLNGNGRDGEFQIEFSQIAEIEKSSPGVRVTLKDGRAFDLYGSNDVNRENRGIAIESAGQHYEIDWRQFRSLRLSR